MHAMTTPTPQPQPHAQMQSLQLPPPMPSQQQERDPALHTRLVLAHGGIPTKIPPADSTVTVMFRSVWLTRCLERSSKQFARRRMLLAAVGS